MPCRRPATEKASGKFDAPNTATGPSATFIRLRSARGGVRSGQGRVDRDIEPFALAQFSREHPKLAAGAPALTLQPRPGQAGFGHGGHDQIVANGNDGIGDRLEKGGARSRVRAANAGKAASASAQASATSFALASRKSAAAVLHGCWIYGLEGGPSLPSSAANQGWRHSTITYNSPSNQVAQGGRCTGQSFRPGAVIRTDSCLAPRPQDRQRRDLGMSPLRATGMIPMRNGICVAKALQDRRALRSSGQSCALSSGSNRPRSSTTSIPHESETVPSTLDLRRVQV